MRFARLGFALTFGAIVLFAVSIAGVAPWVAGPDVNCSERGPHGFFLLAWAVGALLGIAAALILGAASGRGGVDARMRAAGMALAIAVPIAAVVWFVVVVADGIRECGF